MVYNPLDQPVKRTLTLPLYYTGLKRNCRIRREEGVSSSVALDEAAQVQLPLELAAKSATWFVIEATP
jgi:hypothetical protein